MAEVRILGPDGQPIRKDELLREIAVPSIEGIRQPWSESVSYGLTPEGLTELLREAIVGDEERFLSLAEDVEEKDLHYLGVVGDRKRALSGLNVSVEPASESSLDKRIAEAVLALTKNPAFEENPEDLQDCLGKGFSVSEIIWDHSERQWEPVRYQWVEQRWFRFDRETRQQLRLRDVLDPVNGIPLAPFKFMVHKPRIKKGLPIRNGFARIAGFFLLCKMYALKDWMAFAEVFGMPLRLGRYGPNASREDVGILKRAVANIGSDAAAVLPDSMKIEFQAAANVAGGADLYERLCTYIDKQLSKAILGQTMTMDDGSSNAQAKVHNEVRFDILKADAKGLGQTINRDLVKAYVDLNFGVQKRYPRVRWDVIEPEDIKGLTEAIEGLVPIGLKVGQRWMRGKLNIPEPEKDDELLGQPAALPPPAASKAKNLALNAAQAPTTSELMVQQLQDTADSAMDRLLEPVQVILEASSSFEEFRDRLIEAYPDMDTSLLSQTLADALSAAHLAGRYEVLIGQ